MLRYERKPTLRLRPFGPWHAVMVYTPEPPGLHWLNSSSWLILELCDGSAPEAIAARFGTMVPSKAQEAPTLVAKCVADLEQKGLVRAL